MDVTRRDFLRQVSGGALVLSLGHLACGDETQETGSEAQGTGASAEPSAADGFQSWQDLYQGRVKWDRVVKGTHQVNCWYQRGCTWNVFVKDGMVLREEQSATYPQTNSSVPDYNPRGCQKGACYSDRMYDPGRLLHPLKRVGERGAGRWKRVSWAQAMTEVADGLIDVMRDAGPASVYWDMGGGMSNGGAGMAMTRANRILDSNLLDIDAEVGDHHPGAAVTCGKIFFSSSADDCFHSDLILIWGGNPSYTQIPNVHFVNEARYHGARVVAITPDLNSSGIHTDLWVPVEVGSDAAFGLSMAQVIIEEGLYDADFVREQTDLPLLVRLDTRHFLRASDLEAGGAEDGFFVFDEASRQVKAAPADTLDLAGLQPALEGEYPVDTTDGVVMVTPVFELLRRHVAAYDPERAERITGTAPSLVRKLARQIATARAATVLTQSNFSKFYHGLEMERVQFLVFALCGQFGRKGTGVNGFPMMMIDGPMPLALAPTPLGELGSFVLSMMKRMRQKPDETNEMFFMRLARQMYREDRNFISSALLLHHHGGLAPLTGSSRQWDPDLSREPDEYLKEAYDNDWQIAPPGEPKVLFSVGGNLLRRIRGYDRLYQGFLPKLELLVTLDFRMSQTALHSDYVLPAAGWYERDDVAWATPLAPFANATVKAVEPVAESKADWEFMGLLLKTVEERAATRGLRTFTDRNGEERRLDDVYDNFTFHGAISGEDAEGVLKASMFMSSNLGGTSWEKLKEDGHARFTELGRTPVTVTNATDMNPGETITANAWHVEKKMVWPTLTRRMQFYIDHDFYMELGEELPVHKDNPTIGGDHPLQMTGGHTRWSIHSAWRDNPTLLRLQQGEPALFMGTADARARGIDDGDRVRVRNDTGEFQVRVKLSGALRPGQVVAYHAWEPYQFAKHESHQTVTASPFNPIQMAGGYYHLQPMMIVGQPGMNDRGTRVQVEKLGPMEARGGSAAG